MLNSSKEGASNVKNMADIVKLLQGHKFEEENFVDELANADQAESDDEDYELDSILDDDQGNKDDNFLAELNK